MHKILIIEDEADLQELVAYNLQKEGFQVESASSGESGWKRLEASKPDLLVLDWMLPGMSGLDLLARLRRHPRLREIPVLMLTAKAEEDDLVEGLSQGADDYLPKPFSPKVLIARIKSLLRRLDPEENMQILDLEFFPLRNQVLLAGNPMNLTLTEFKVLYFLARQPGRVYSRDQIMNAAHGADHMVADRAIDVTIVGLRKKLGAREHYIETVRGLGYRFKGEA